MKTSPAKNQNDHQALSQVDALALLHKLRDELFESNTKQLATALGRTSDEIEAWQREEETIDADALLKMRGLAQQRNLTIA